ncbi:MAG: hypothetical protein Q4C48_00650 [Lachnospiraceae bacterium]|nr:hypothetical protein [Lachnospiraceae bacterium]
MLGLIYLCLCFTVGFTICSLVWPDLAKRTATTYRGQAVGMSPLFLLLPAWFATGTISMVWTTYLLGLAFQNAKEPLLYANAIVIPVAMTLSVIGILRHLLRGGKKKGMLTAGLQLREIVFIICTGMLVLLLMWWSFFIRDGKLYVGFSIFSDFSPHLGMIRSFSVGNNFPTQYSHYAGADIKYHFLFQFFVGNLEFLGLPLDYAFNLPSAFSLIGAFFLLYALAVKLTGRRFTGYLAALFFAFRSSDAFFDYVAQIPEGTSVLTTLRENTTFIGTTLHEDWGLWNLNVYCNQRHLALGICVMLFLIYMLLDAVFEGVERVRRRYAEEQERLVAREGSGMLPSERVALVLRESLFRAQGWTPNSLVSCVGLGILLGAAAFFNGACVIACLAVLFCLAIVSDRRLEYMVVACLTVFLSLLQSSLFINGSAVQTEYLFGFLADNKTLFGAWDYIMTLCGILPLVLLAAFLVSDGVHKWIMAAFTAPFVVAFTLSLTVDVTVNHKYIMLSVMLLSVYAAVFVNWLWHRRGFWTKAVSLFLVAALTVTGIYDLTVILKKNDSRAGRCMVLDLEDPVTQWIAENATSQDIFLTYYYSLNNVVMGGAMLYYGWPYYAWSAGYDTAAREENAWQMYSASSPEKLTKLVEENNIRFIIVDDDVRNSDDYAVNEDNIRATYACVFSYGTLNIYDTTAPSGE